MQEEVLQTEYGKEMMYKEKIFARMIDIGIKAFSIFGRHTSRSIEYNFAMRNIFSKGELLDVGSTGSLFPLKLANNGYNVYAVDVRKYHEKHPNLTVKNTPFPDKFFDMITCISAIEHIGLSAYGDPKYEKGDRLAMKEFKRILKTNGRLILTTPFSGEYKIMSLKNTYERIYNYEKLSCLFQGWLIKKEEYYIPKKWKYWIKTTREEAEKIYDIYQRSNLSCFVLEKGN